MASTESPRTHWPKNFHYSSYVFTHVYFAPRSSKTWSFPYTYFLTQCSSFISLGETLSGSWPRTLPVGTTCPIPFAQVIKRKITKTHFVKPQRTCAQACSLHLHSGITKGAWISLHPHLELHYTIHMTSSLFDGPHPSRNDDYQFWAPLCSPGQCLTDLASAVFIISRCHFLP